MASLVTARKAAEEQLIHDAFHDALTGLPNRALFRDRLLHAINRSIRMSSYLYAVLFLDVDRFKVINDSLGHAVKDELLVVISKRLTACLRPGDTVARLGGDEFAILLDNIRNRGDAADVAERIRTEFGPSFLIQGNEIFITQSIGIAVRTDRYEYPEQVLSDADIAMYEAKARGKACPYSLKRRCITVLKSGCAWRQSSGLQLNITMILFFTISRLLM